MKLLRKYRKPLCWTIGAGLAGVLALAAVYFAVELRGSRISRSAEEIEPRDIGLVLGARSGSNPYFRYRIEAAAELYHAGKVKKLLVSGDNGRKDYNEPHDMRDALIEKGVPAEDIVCDYAGFRTLDSVIRADRIFGQKKFTVISQPFHCKRAIFLADYRGIDAIGFAARDVHRRRNLWSGVGREVLARAGAVADLTLHRRPRYLGKVEPITVTTLR